jgi:hypothetical protein
VPEEQFDGEYTDYSFGRPSSRLFKNKVILETTRQTISVAQNQRFQGTTAGTFLECPMGLSAIACLRQPSQV